MAFVKLGDLCYESPGLFTGTPDEVIDYVDISSVDNSAKCVTGYESIRFAEAPSRARRHAEKGNILVSTVRPNLNAVAMCDFDVPHRLVVSTGFCVLSCKAGVNQDFVFFFCQSRKFIESLVKQATGASYPAVNDSIIRGVMLPAYSYAEQTAIASRLKTLRRIIALHQCQLRTLDTLVKSQFVEMAQGPNSKPIRMGEIATFINGAAFKPKDWSTTGRPIIRIQNLNDVSADYNYYAGELEDKYLVRPGEVLISWATHLEAYIWNNGEGWLNQHIFRTVFDKMDVDKTFFVFAANVALKEAFKKAHGFKATMEHIKRGDFEESVVMLPPIEVQRQFGRFAEQVDKSKVLVQAALDKAQTLFDSLMQQYFG